MKGIINNQDKITDVSANLELNGEKLIWQAHKPFDLILEMNDCQLWCRLVDTFRNGQIAFDIRLGQIQKLYSSFGIELKI